MRQWKQARLWVSVLGLSMVAGAIWAEPELAENEASWVESGETFYYRLRWGIFEVGAATMAVQGPVDYHGHAAFEIAYSIQTNAWANKFYPINNTMHAYVDPELNRTFGFIQQQREGKVYREVQVVVDWTNQEAKRTNFGAPDGEQSLSEDTLDPMSLVYALRTISLVLGDSISIPTTDGNRLVQTEIQVKQKEKIAVPAGRFEALLLESDTKDLEGVFRKSKGAGIDLWVTNDYRKIPIKMQSKVKVGSFAVELVRIEGPNQEVPALLEEPRMLKKRRARRRH